MQGILNCILRITRENGIGNDTQANAQQKSPLFLNMESMGRMLL